MMMKKPAKCITPKTDRHEYKLTARDLNNLIKLVKEANDILSYYSNMPENKTGELETAQCDKLQELVDQVEDLATTLNYVTWL